LNGEANHYAGKNKKLRHGENGAAKTLTGNLSKIENETRGRRIRSGIEKRSNQTVRRQWGKIRKKTPSSKHRSPKRRKTSTTRTRGESGNLEHTKLEEEL